MDRLARRFEHVDVKLFDTCGEVAERYRRPSAVLALSNVRVKFEQQDGYSAARRLEAANAGEDPSPGRSVIRTLNPQEHHVTNPLTPVKPNLGHGSQSG